MLLLSKMKIVANNIRYAIDRTQGALVMMQAFYDIPDTNKTLYWQEATFNKLLNVTDDFKRKALHAFTSKTTR